MSDGKPSYYCWAVKLYDEKVGEARTEEVIATSAVRARRQLAEPGIRIISSHPMGRSHFADLMHAARGLLLKAIRDRKIQFRGGFNEEEKALYDALALADQAPPLAGGDAGRPRG